MDGRGLVREASGQQMQFGKLTKSSCFCWKPVWELARGVSSMPLLDPGKKSSCFVLCFGGLALFPLWSHPFSTGLNGAFVGFGIPSPNDWSPLHSLPAFLASLILRVICHSAVRPANPWAGQGTLFAGMGGCERNFDTGLGDVTCTRGKGALHVLVPNFLEFEKFKFESGVLVGYAGVFVEEKG